MLSTLILLYALDTGQIPVGCYVAAWVLTIVKRSFKGVLFILVFAEQKSEPLARR